MKTYLNRILLSVGVVAAMAASSVSLAGANGGVIYKKGKSLATAKATLEFKKGENSAGQFVLKSGEVTLTSSAYGVKHHMGKNTAIIVFPMAHKKRLDSFGAEHHHHAVVLHGSYLRGDNMAFYYGDIYATGCHHEGKCEPKKIVDEFEKADHPGKHHHHHKAHYVGGFKFEKAIAAPKEPVPAPKEPKADFEDTVIGE